MEELKWALGLAFAATLAGVGYVINAVNALSARQKTDNDAMHSRINEVKDNYVKKSDLDAHMARMEKGMDDVRESMKETNSTLMKLHEQQGRLLEMSRVSASASMLNVKPHAE